MTNRKERTPFGKTLAKWRVDVGMNQAEMASLLGISGAHLSAVELGEKGMKNALSWIDVLVSNTPFQLKDHYQQELIKTGWRSAKQIVIDLTPLTEQQQSLVLLFGSKISTLDADSLAEIYEILKNN